MKTLLVTACALAGLNAQSPPVVHMQMDPDQIARSLRERTPVMPAADCAALDLWECHTDEPARVRDISLHWIQLDDDPELEAVIVAEAKVEMSWVAYVFDKQGSWNLVGSFFCRQRCEDYGGSLVTVRKLTEDSPPLVLCTRDLGGSGSTIITTEAFQLRGGRLWPVFQITDYMDTLFVDPHVERQRVLASANRLVIHTIREKPRGHVTSNKCEVWQWNNAKHAFIPITSEQTKYCDPGTGGPIPEKSFLISLPGDP